MALNQTNKLVWIVETRKDPVNPKNPVGITISWLEGEGEPDNNRHCPFVNPLADTSENKWHKIWEE